MKGVDSWCPALVGVVFVGTLYLLLAYHVNRYAIRANDREWIFRRGPLPTLDVDLGWRFEKTVDPTRFHQVTSSAVVEEKGDYRWSSARSRSLTGLLLVRLPLDLAFRHHHETRETRITYDLWMRPRRGLDRKVLSHLSREQVEYLVQVLQPLLAKEESGPGRTDAPPARLWCLRDEDNRSPPGQAEVGRLTAAPRIVAASEEEGVLATLQAGAEQSPMVCAACSAANPADSAFCGECAGIPDRQGTMSRRLVGQLTRPGQEPAGSRRNWQLGADRSVVQWIRGR